MKKIMKARHIKVVKSSYSVLKSIEDKNFVPSLSSRSLQNFNMQKDLGRKEPPFTLLQFEDCHIALSNMQKDLPLV